MRILFLNSYSSVHGGAERLVFDTSTELIARGHDVSIVVANDDRRSPNPEIWPARVNRYYVPELTIPLTDRYNYNRLRRSPQYRDTLRYLQDIVTIEEPDIIHVHNFPRIEVLEEIRLTAPMVRTIHSYENLCGNQLKRLPGGSLCSEKLGPACKTRCGIVPGFKSTRVRAENRMMNREFRRVIAVSSYIKKVLVANGFSEDTIRVLSNFTRFTSVPFRAESVSEENAVLYVGRLTPEKGLLELLESMSLMASKARLVVIGKDGVLGQSSFQQQVVDAAVRGRIEVEFQDWCAGDALRRAYRKAKVVAFSSVWPEPFGLVGIEAMMQGKPVVAFDSGGVGDWLKHGETGFIVPHLDLKQYAARLDQLIADDGMRRAMGQAAQEFAIEKFSAGAHINELLALYKEVVDEGLADRPGRRTAVCDAQCGFSLSL